MIAENNLFKEIQMNAFYKKVLVIMTKTRLPHIIEKCILQ